MTRAFKQDAFESAAWKVFSGIGLDAATVRDIVALSNVSPGSFYNYYKTKEAIFDIILVKVAQRVRGAARQARSEEDDRSLSGEPVGICSVSTQSRRQAYGLDCTKSYRNSVGR